jgi:imidazolonepropionase-like amidohydrolase
MNKAGVKLLAGTDMGANPLCFPGISLHRELELLVHSGLSPAEALKTATLHPAIYLGIENDYGSVGEGKMADVVLLAANPLDDIKNTQKIFGVIRKGQILDKNDIRQELIEISTLQTR